ncbi:MAG: hypothetical protein AAF518_29120 [Spirochaetota bacterium]
MKFFFEILVMILGWIGFVFWILVIISLLKTLEGNTLLYTYKLCGYSWYEYGGYTSNMYCPSKDSLSTIVFSIFTSLELVFLVWVGPFVCPIHNKGIPILIFLIRAIYAIYELQPMISYVEKEVFPLSSLLLCILVLMPGYIVTSRTYKKLALNSKA